MPTFVDVLGVGNIEFPDGMSPEDIKVVLDDHFGKKQPALYPFSPEDPGPEYLPPPQLAQPTDVPKTVSSSGLDSILKALAAMSHGVSTAPLPSDFQAIAKSPPAQAIGQGLELEGNVAKGALQDVAQSLRATATGSTADLNPAENIIAAARGEETPFSKETADVTGGAKILQGIAEGAAHMAPAVALSAGLGAVGVPPVPSAALAFGFDKEGFNPKQAALMGIAPVVGKFGKDAAVKLLQKAGARLGPAAVEALKQVSSFAATQAYFDLISVPEYLSLPPDQRMAKWAEQAGLNLMMHLPGIPGIVQLKLDSNKVKNAFETSSFSANQGEGGSFTAPEQGLPGANVTITEGQPPIRATEAPQLETKPAIPETIAPKSETKPVENETVPRGTTAKTYVVYHGGPSNALESNWPKWWTTNQDRANAYGRGNFFTATVTPRNPFVSAVTLAPETVESLFQKGHDAILIGNADNPVDVIVPNQERLSGITKASAVPGTPAKEAGPTPGAGSIPETIAPATEIQQVPMPARFDTVEQLLDFRKQRHAEEVALYREQIGLSQEQAQKLFDLLAADRETTKFEKTLTPEQQAKLTWFMDESPFNKREGNPFQSIEPSKNLNPESLRHENSVPELANALVQAVTKTGDIEPSATSDRFLFAAVAARKLLDAGGSFSDVARALDSWSTRNSGSQGDKEFAFKHYGAKIKQFLDAQGIALPQGDLSRARTLPNEPASRAVPAPATAPAATAAGTETATAPATAPVARAAGKIPKDRPRKTREGEVVGEGDVIDYLKANSVKIRRHTNAGEGSKGFWSDTYRELRKLYHSKDFFTDTGLPPDEVVEEMRRSGFVGPDYTVDDLWSDMLASHTARVEAGKAPKKEAAQLDIQAAVHESKLRENRRMLSEAVDGMQEPAFWINGRIYTPDSIRGVDQFGYVYPTGQKLKANEFSQALDDASKSEEKHGLNHQARLWLKEYHDALAAKKAAEEAKGPEMFAPDAGKGEAPKTEPTSQMKGISGQRERLVAPDLEVQPDIFGGAAKESQDIPLFTQNLPPASSLTETSPITPITKEVALSVADTFAKENPTGPTVRVINDPKLERNGGKIQGYLAADGGLVINAAHIGSVEEAHEIVREEWGERKLATPEGRKKLAEFVAKYITDADLAPLRKLYRQGLRETAERYRDRLANEWTAKQARAKPSWWGELVDRVKGWLNSVGIRNLSKEEAARALLRSLTGDGTIVREPGAEPAMSVQPLLGKEAVEAAVAAQDQELPADVAFKNKGMHAENRLSAGIIRDPFEALPKAVQRFLPMVKERLAAETQALAQLPGYTPPTGDLRTMATSLSGGSLFDRDAIVMRAGVSIIDLADSAETFIKETEAKTKEFADVAKVEAAKTAREKATQAASKVINVRRGQLIEQRDKASVPADRARLNAELDLVGHAEAAAENVVEAIRDRLPRTITLPDLLVVADGLKGSGIAATDPILDSIRDAIRSNGEALVKDFQALKDAKDSPRLAALRAELEARQSAAKFLDTQVLKNPEFRTNWEQAQEMIGEAASPMTALDTATGARVFTNPIAPHEKITLSTGLRRDDYLDNDFKLATAQSWYQDYLNPAKVPNPNPLKAASARQTIAEIDILRSQQMDPKTGNQVFGSGVLDFAIKMFTFFRVPDRILETIGGQAATDSAREVKNFSRLQNLSNAANVRNKNGATDTAKAAAKSHGMDWEQWKDEIGDPVLGSYQNRDDVKIREGMTVIGGHVVNKLDMEAVRGSKRYVDAIIGALRTLEKGLEGSRQSPVRILDRIGNTVLQRLSIDPTGFTVPQTLRRAAVGFLDRWEKATTPEMQEDLLNSPAYFRAVTLSHADSFTDPAYATAVDSPLKSLYLEAVKRWKGTSLIPTTLDEVAKDIFDHSAHLPPDAMMSEAEIKAQIVKDIDRTVKLFTENETAETSKVGELPEIDIIRAENFLNRPRGRRILPKGLYEYTVPDNNSQNRIINAGLEVYAQRFLNSLTALEKSMATLESQFDTDSKGDPDFQKKVRAQQAAGEIWLNPKELKSVHTLVRNEINRFKDYMEKRQEVEQNLYSGFNLARRSISNNILQAPGTMVANAAGSVPQRAILNGLMGSGAGMLNRIPIIAGTLTGAKGLYDTGMAVVGHLGKALSVGTWKRPEFQAAAEALKKNPDLWARVGAHLVSKLHLEMRDYMEARELGIIDYDPWRENLHSAWHLFGEGGYLTPKSQNRGKIRKYAESITTLLNETGLGVTGPQLPRALGTQGVDRMVNGLASDFTIGKLDDIKLAAAKLTRPASEASTALLTPKEVLGPGGTIAELSNLRQFYRRASINLDRAMIEYSVEVKKAIARGLDPKDIQILTDSQFNSLHYEYAENLNKGNFSTRPFFGSNVGAWLGLFRGYGIAQNAQIAALLRRHSSDLRKIRPEVASQILNMMTTTILTSWATYPIIGSLLWWLWHEKQKTKSMGDVTDLKDAVKTTLQQSGRQMPIAASALVSLFGAGVPGSGMATYGITSVPESVASRIIAAGSQAIQTGEPVRPIVELARSLRPNSRVWINRLEMREGITKESNARALAASHVPAGMDVKAARSMGSVQYSPASANVANVANALSMDGGPDWQTVDSERQAGVAKLVAAGKNRQDAEKSFDTSVLQRNFYRQAWGREPTEAERTEFRGSLSQSEIQIVDDIEKGRQQYAGRFGRTTPDFVKVEPGGSSGQNLLGSASLGSTRASGLGNASLGAESTRAASESTVPRGSGGGSSAGGSSSRSRGGSRLRGGRSRSIRSRAGRSARLKGVRQPRLRSISARSGVRSGRRKRLRV